MSNYEVLVSSVERYLQSEKSFSQESSKTGSEISNFLSQLRDTEEINLTLSDNSIKPYLSYAAADSSNAIMSGGPHGGYWCDVRKGLFGREKTVDEVTVGAGKNKINITEKILYPVVKSWLELKGYVARDVSSLKKGGKWGNPDIIGIDRVELFSAVQIEIVSCEVKLSVHDWERFIFEAVSHKRMANRSWYILRQSSEEELLPKGIIDYAERYRVGICTIMLNDQQLISLTSGKSAPEEYLTSVREIFPAPFDHVSLREMKSLAERMEIKLTLGFEV
jgi:hypothetical protein